MRARADELPSCSYFSFVHFHPEPAWVAPAAWNSAAANGCGRSFLGCTFGIEIDESEQDIFVGHVQWPVVGFGYGCIELIVDVPEHRDEAALMDNDARRIQ